MPEMNPALANQFNTTLEKVKPTSILTFDRKVSAIPGIVKLTVGEPDFAVPEVGKQAAIAAIENDDSHYAPGTGSQALRQAISHFMADRYQLDYDPNSEIAVTIGATEAIFTSLFSLINPGDEVLIPTPTFPLYATVATMVGGVPVSVELPAPDFVLTPDLLKQALADHPKAKALVLNYPGNPTGTTYTADQLKALAAVLKETKLVVNADEIYSELTYGVKHVSLASFLPGQTLILNGASKSGAMTGYRIGFIAGPAALMKKLIMVHSILITAPSDPAMAAAVPLFGSEAGKQATEEMRQAYQERRDFLTAAFTRLGFEVASPAGAFYLFVKLPASQGTADVAFATKAAEEAAVAMVPGSFFGAGGAGYLRLSYATSMDKLHLAVDRLEKFLKEA